MTHVEQTEIEWALLNAIADALWFSVEVDYLRKNNTINYISKYLDSQELRWNLSEPEPYINEIRWEIHMEIKESNLTGELV